MDYLHNRTKVVTVVRKFIGDSDKLAAELRSICGMAHVEVRPGKLLINGKHSENVKKWMELLGF